MRARPAGMRLDELHAGLHLGQHAAGRELSLLDVLVRFVHGHGVDFLLFGRVEVQADLVHRSEDDEEVRPELPGQNRAREVLVYDGLDLGVEVVVLDDGNAGTRRQATTMYPSSMRSRIWSISTICADGDLPRRDASRDQNPP